MILQYTKILKILKIPCLALIYVGPTNLFIYFFIYYIPYPNLSVQFSCPITCWVDYDVIDIRKGPSTIIYNGNSVPHPYSMQTTGRNYLPHSLNLLPSPLFPPALYNHPEFPPPPPILIFPSISNMTKPNLFIIHIRNWATHYSLHSLPTSLPLTRPNSNPILWIH